MKPKSIKFVAMTIREGQKKLLFQLYHLYDNREASSIADLVMEKLTGWKRIDRVLHSQVKLSEPMVAELDQITARLATHQPVQYVLQEAWFLDMPFFVDERVLIPRPETEELVQWVVADHKAPGSKIALDIGTGSGCMAVALAKSREDWQVHACDVSTGALEVAAMNASNHGVNIQFHLVNILLAESRSLLPKVDIIISNPPYIPREETSGMEKQVVENEPHLALFVPGDDPLLFYRVMAEWGKEKLLPGGKIYVETHYQYAPAVAELFLNLGYGDVCTRKDLHGNERMVRATVDAH